MRYVVPRAVYRYNAGVREQLCPMATYRLHEIAFRPVDKKNWTLEPPDESLDLSLRHRSRGAVAQHRIVFPPVTAAFEACSVVCHVKSSAVGNEWKRLLQRFGCRFQ